MKKEIKLVTYLLKRIIAWCSCHRYILGMNPKGWDNEIEYLKWSNTQRNIKSIF